MIFCVMRQKLSKVDLQEYQMTIMLCSAASISALNQRKNDIVKHILKLSGNKSWILHPFYSLHLCWAFLGRTASASEATHVSHPALSSLLSKQLHVNHALIAARPPFWLEILSWFLLQI